MNESAYKIMQAKDHRHASSYMSALEFLSLDACKPFYQFLCLPRSFTPDALKIIRNSLKSKYDDMSDAAQDRLLLQFFINYSDAFGDTATYQLADWMAAINFHDLPFTSRISMLMVIVLPSIEYNSRFTKWKGQIPLRLERYFNFYKLMDPQDDPTEQGLLPEQLHTAWDLWMLEQYADESDPNLWNPSIYTSVIADNIRSRIAWHNAFQRPTATAEEFAQAREWIILNTDDKERARSIPDLSTLKLPERLVNEYIAQKLIV